MKQRSNQDILKAAIEKASSHDSRMAYIAADLNEIIERLGMRALTMDVIFSHDFAKAFWGEEDHRLDTYTSEWSHYDCGEDDYCYMVIPEWQWHLQQMVLESEPLRYIERFL